MAAPARILTLLKPMDELDGGLEFFEQMDSRYGSVP
jgi:hypothetical protein